MSIIEGILNEESNKAKQKSMEISYIKIGEIEDNAENNGYSMNDIESLAQSVKLNGLEQPLVVRRIEKNRYSLLTGHRRLSAIKNLIKSGDWKEEHVPCIVKNPAEIDLPLSDELKEMLSILSTNCQRKKTDADRMFEITNWKKIYSELKKNGVEVISYGTDAEGKPVEKQIKGERTRSLVAETVGVSDTQVGKYETVELNGSDKLKAEVEAGNISINAAARMAGFEKDEQDLLIFEGSTTPKKFEEKEKQNKEKKAKEKKEGSSAGGRTSKKNSDTLLNTKVNDDGTYRITKSVIMDDLKEVIRFLEDHDVRLNEAQYFDYLSEIKRFYDVFNSYSMEQYGEVL